MDEGPIRNLQYIDLESPTVSVSGGGFLDSLVSFFMNLWEAIKLPSLLITLAFITLGVYAYIRIHQIRKAQKEELQGLTIESRKGSADPTEKRWKRVLNLSESPNENDWRQAVLEADIILDEMLIAMRYSGSSLGERLKQVEKSDFTSIDSAWEAHKVRNKVAHEGSDLNLSHREVRRIILLYKEVFEEFKLI